MSGASRRPAGSSEDGRGGRPRPGSATRGAAAGRDGGPAAGRGASPLRFAAALLSVATVVWGCGEGGPGGEGGAGGAEDGPGSTPEARGPGRSAAAGTAVGGSPPASAPSRAAGDDWATYGGVPAATRYSGLREVHRGNVAELERAWTHRTGVRGIFEATPIVVDGALYLSTPVDGGRQEVEKLDAATGEPIWETVLEIEARRPEPTAASRGVAVHRGRVYVATLDARLVALDADDGAVVWAVRTADPARGYQHKQAPLAHGGRVYLGVSGGPLGIRGS